MLRSLSNNQTHRAGGSIDPAWAWAPYAPDKYRPWNLKRVGHLYRRAAFGVDGATLKRALAEGPEAAVTRLVRPTADLAAFNKTYDSYDAAVGSTDGLRAWWLRRMIHSPQPLLEKLTLFWHGHFGISHIKVKSASLMQQHVALLRTHALGCFKPLLAALVRDPALLMGLECSANRKAQPTVTLARELMRTYCLGEDGFTEKDVREAARAFTGVFVLRSRLRTFPREHDSGTKTVFGKTGAFAGDDVVRLVLDHPATSCFLVRKLYRFFISETEDPADDLIAPLAESFGRTYDVAAVVETILRSNLLFSDAVYRCRIKSPVEFAVGIVSALDGMVSTSQLGTHLAALGQDLYNPPTVKGWEGGRTWITRSTLTRRSNLARELLAVEGPYGGKLDPLAVATALGHETEEAQVRFLLDLLVDSELEKPVRAAVRDTLNVARGRDRGSRLRVLAGAVAVLPEFQLA